MANVGDETVRISKFIENELDRVNEYLSMAKANLITTKELCENYCVTIVPELNTTDEKVVNYLNKNLLVLDSKIDSAKEVINEFKRYYYLIQK